MNKVFILLLLVVVFTGCSQAPIRVDTPKEVNNLSDFATLNLYRPSEFGGSAIAGKVRVNGETRARISSGGHIELKVPVGGITLSVGKDKIDIDTKSKETYFVKVTPIFRLRLFGPPPFELVSISKDEAEKYKVK